MKIGLMGAMPEEMNKIIAAISEKRVSESGSRLYYEGKLNGFDVVAAFSRWGKVASATTAAHLILKYGVDQLIFTGVAGGIAPELHVGDVVIAERLFQHDMDARPLMRRYEIPLTGKTSFEIPGKRTKLMQQAVHNFLKNNPELRQQLAEEGISAPKLIPGDIASGDLFVSDDDVRKDILRNLPSVLCVEMEGAAVAQVCHDYDVPLQVVRVISDTADEEAPISSIDFAQRFGGDYSLGIIREYLTLLKEMH